MLNWLKGMKGVKWQLPSVIFSPSIDLTDSLGLLLRRRGTTGVWGRSPQVLNDTNTHLKTFHITYFLFLSLYVHNDDFERDSLFYMSKCLEGMNTGVWGRSPQVLNDTNTHLKTFHITYFLFLYLSVFLFHRLLLNLAWTKFSR